MPKKKKIVKLKPLDRNRLKITYLFSIFLILGLFGRLVNLQVFNASNLQKKARSIQFRRTSYLNKRRTIVDRNNRLIAYDKPLYKLWAHPAYFDFPGDNSKNKRSIDEVVRKLAPILNEKNEFLIDKLKGKVSGVKLSETLNEEQASRIRKLYISGLDVEKYSKRYYPQGNLYANLVGFVNDEHKGSSGLELHLDNHIKLKKKGNILKTGALGTPLPDVSGPKDFVNDDEKVFLTIDSRLQKISFNALSKQVKEWKAKKGFALVMNVNSGEILSLISIPSFNPNRFWEYNPEVYKGWYTQDLLEPGSTFKPINLALALEEKVIKVDGVVEDKGIINVGGWTLSNWDKKGNGFIDYPRVLQVSSNVGMVKIMQNLEPAVHWEWLEKLGINKNIKTDIFESTPGQLKEKDIFINHPIEQAVTSFGKGFAISPMKLGQLHAILANGGMEVTPHVTADFNKKLKNEIRKRYFSKEVSQTILNWMESVVNKGSGKAAKIDGYRIGGKTGTSQKAINGIYSDKKTCSFVATLPINEPKYLILVVVDEPSQPYAYGSTVAVPVVKEIIESLIVIEKIPPTLKEEKIIVKKP